MTLLSSASNGARHLERHGHFVPMLLSGALGAVAVAVVGYLLWPTWTADGSNDPTQLPILVGATLFNVPTASVRVRAQQHSGSQDRIDLSFTYIRREAESPLARDSEAADSVTQGTDVIFLSIAAHNGAMPPEERMRTVYPRYLSADTSPTDDGLITHPFRENTPYADEDLFVAAAPRLVARCTREAETPGMCLSESRLDGADLTFRFPRSWLNNWRDVTDAMDRIVTLIYKPH